VEDVEKIVDAMGATLTRVEWEAVRNLFGSVIRTKRYGEETEVDKIDLENGSSSIYWLAVLRKLQDAGAGRLILGRKGLKSRFKWSPATVEIAALMDSSGAATAPSHQGGSARDSGHHARLPLGNNRVVELQLPPNLTEAEEKMIFEYLKLILKQA